MGRFGVPFLAHGCSGLAASGFDWGWRGPAMGSDRLAKKAPPGQTLFSYFLFSGAGPRFLNFVILKIFLGEKPENFEFSVILKIFSILGSLCVFYRI